MHSDQNERLERGMHIIYLTKCVAWSHGLEFSDLSNCITAATQNSQHSEFQQ
jgi:hypothetical protein